MNIAGPPFWLDRIMERMKKEGKTVHLPESQILTGGGWKAEENKRTPGGDIPEESRGGPGHSSTALS